MKREKLIKRAESICSKQSDLNLYFMIIKLIIIVLIVNSLLLVSSTCFSQNPGVGINNAGNPANSKALLDIDATGMSPKAGILIPRMNTNDRNAISAPIPESLLIYNTDTHCFEAYYNWTWVSWSCLGSACQITAQPITGTHTPSKTQIVWNWNSVSGATGYQWNTTSTYPGVGVNSLSNNTYTQTGLICNTTYTLFVWSYNSCGNSSALTLTQTTSACCSGPIACGGSGNITTTAGNGTAGFAGDGGQAVCAELNSPNGIATDISGNVYIADWSNHRIRKVTVSTGIISTIAGTGTGGYTGDGGAATNAELNYPASVAVDGSGNVYIADDANNRIRKVNAYTGIISTVAGNGTAGYTGDGGAATLAELNNPQGVAVNSAGTLIYIADESNQRIRMVNVSGVISTIAGNGTAGYSGDGGPAINAEIWGSPSFSFSVALDASGSVYIADMGNNRIRKITGTTINTIAGNGFGAPNSGGFSGDGGQATNAELYYPTAVTFDATGNMYIADWHNQRVRMVNTSGNISTIAGNGTGGFTGDGGSATNAEFLYPNAVAVDNSGNIYVVDWLNQRVREVCK